MRRKWVVLDRAVELSWKSHWRGGGEVEERWRRGGGGRETVSRSLRRSRQRLTSSRSKSVAIFSREARLFVFLWPHASWAYPASSGGARAGWEEGKGALVSRWGARLLLEGRGAWRQQGGRGGEVPWPGLDRGGASAHRERSREGEGGVLNGDYLTTGGGENLESCLWWWWKNNWSCYVL